MQDRLQSDIPPHDYPSARLLIRNKWISDRPSCGDVVNPSDEGVLGSVPGASTNDLDDALSAARDGFEIWRRTRPAARSAVMHRAAALMRERAEAIAPVITLEQGKPIHESRAEIDRGASFIEWDAEQLLRTCGRIIPSQYPMTQHVVREPVGPVAAFTPWNVPFSSPCRKIGGALAAGCSVVIKPSEETPACACLLAQCFLDAGLPEGVLNIVFGNPQEISEYLILSPIIRMVTLTGSVGVGKQLTRLAAGVMKPALMELGGHAPVLIDDGVDVYRVAQLAAASKFRTAGQICASPTRFIIHQNVYEQFVGALSSEAAALKVGDGFVEGTQMGPLASARRLAAVTSLVENALELGAQVGSGGHRIGNHGYFYAPTVLCDVPHDAAVMNTEPFGPIAACVPVAEMSDGLAIANRLDVGLCGYVFSNSMDKLDELTNGLQCGVVGANGFAVSGPDAPFGGYKESGLGREGGAESLDPYLVTKTIIRSTNCI